MIDVLDGGVVARRIGGYVVLQRDGNIDQPASHSSLLSCANEAMRVVRLCLVGKQGSSRETSGLKEWRSLADLAKTVINTLKKQLF